MKTDWYKNVNPNLDKLAQILGMGKKPSHGYTIAEKAPEVVTAPGVYFPAEKGEVIPLESRQGGGGVSSSWPIQLGTMDRRTQGLDQLWYSPISPFRQERKPQFGKEDMSMDFGKPPAEPREPEYRHYSLSPFEQPALPQRRKEIEPIERLSSLINPYLLSREKGGSVTPSKPSSKDNESRKLDILESIIASIKPAGLESNSLMGLVIPPEPLKIEQSKYDILKSAISILKPPAQQKSSSGGGGSSQTKAPSPKSSSSDAGVNLPTPPTVPTSMEGIPTPQSIQPEIRTDSPEINPMSGNLVNLNREDNLSTQMFPRQRGGTVTPSFEEWRKKYPEDWSEGTLKSLAQAAGIPYRSDYAYDEAPFRSSYPVSEDTSSADRADYLRNIIQGREERERPLVTPVIQQLGMERELMNERRRRAMEESKTGALSQALPLGSSYQLGEGGLKEFGTTGEIPTEPDVWPKGHEVEFIRGRDISRITEEGEAPVSGMFHGIPFIKGEQVFKTPEKGAAALSPEGKLAMDLFDKPLSQLTPEQLKEVRDKDVATSGIREFEIATGIDPSQRGTPAYSKSYMEFLTGKKQAIQITDPMQQKKLGVTLRKEFNALQPVKDYRDIETRFNIMGKAIEESKTTKNFVAVDQALITIFNKMTDPQSVVRESEYVRTPQDLALWNRIKGKVAKWGAGGAGLTPDDRNALYAMAKQFQGAYESKFNQLRNEYRGYAVDYSLDPETVIKGGGKEVEKKVVKKFYSSSTGKTKYVYDDGTEEIK